MRGFKGFRRNQGGNEIPLPDNLPPFNGNNWSNSTWNPSGGAYATMIGRGPNMTKIGIVANSWPYSAIAGTETQITPFDIGGAKTVTVQGSCSHSSESNNYAVVTVQCSNDDVTYTTVASYGGGSFNQTIDISAYKFMKINFSVRAQSYGDPEAYSTIDLNSVAFA